MKLTPFIAGLGLVVLLTSRAALAVDQVDAQLPDYKKGEALSGKLTSVGSDTLANLMTFWVEDFKKLYPGVQIEVQAAGSSTAPPALTEGTSNFGPMSRLMKDAELQAFQKKYGYPPLAVPVAIDALAVFVNKDNPIQSLSIPQVDAIFSSTLTCGNFNEINTWGEAGLTDAQWADKPIQLFGRNSVSGTYGYFKEHALCKGDLKKGVNEQPGSSAVVQSVSESLNAIGYSGIGYKTAGVRAVPLSQENDSPAIEATSENAIKGTYPLSRYLYIYVNKAPGKSLTPLEREFLRFVLSKQGQQIVLKDGYIALPSDIEKKSMAEIDTK
jgi:phosphate transport system substrate-binding protein